ncbi:unnamed protein product [Linum trigynum]|uniref:Uncharacterized protein n=1 Tax=Linum trigynum TaxID=586398 RepID=A0AAV2GK94_9ROSI
MAGFSNIFAFVMATTIALVLVAEISHGVVAAARPLHGEQIKWRDESFILRIQSLQRGPVPPSQPSPCGHTPDGGTGHCPLTEMNYAGGRFRSRHALPPPGHATTTSFPSSDM